MIATRLLRVLGGAGVMLVLATAFTPLPNLLSYWMAPARPLERADAIVVIGGGGVAPDGSLSNSSLRGAIDGIALYRKGLAPLLVFSGGASSGLRAEAAVRADLARAGGVPSTAIVTAPPGRTTRDEALQLRSLLQPHGIHKIVLVADAQGMARAMGVFERVGFDVIPAQGMPVLDLGGGPGDRLNLMRYLMIEMAAKLYYRMAGYL